MEAYAGIGSRDAPAWALELAEVVADGLRFQGMRLRSGHAQGMDQAFEWGAGGEADIFLPWPSFERAVPVMGKVVRNPSPEAYRIAQTIHPAWHKMGRGGKACHARNVHQVLGADLRSPVAYVLCWTEGGKVAGGTATAITLALRRGIRVFNLGRRDDRVRIETFAADRMAEIA